MDRITFVIAPQELGVGPDECAEPVINRRSLIDLIKRAEREPVSLAGLRPNDLLTALRVGRAPSGPEPSTIQVLRCTCGDYYCGWASVRISMDPYEVIWDDFRTGRADGWAALDIGPFRFARGQYEDALREPERASAPVRDTSALARLATGVPSDHRAWLEELYIETEGDGFFSEEYLPVTRAGLKALAARGDPLLEAEAAAWGRQVGFRDKSLERVLRVVAEAHG